MFCYFDALKDELTSFRNKEDMFDNVPVTYQRNIQPYQTLRCNLSCFLERVEHQDKSKIALVKFFESLLAHPRIMLGVGKETYNSIPQYNIDWKSALNEKSHEKFIDSITKNNYILIRSLYIQEDRKSKQAKKGKSQSMFVYINANVYNATHKPFVEMMEHVEHLYFIDTLIHDTDVCTL